MRVRILLSAVVLLLSACNGSETTETPVSITTSSTEAPTTTTTAAVSAQSTPPASTPPSADISHLTAVRAAAQGAGDRVTFEFDGTTVPGYSVQYVPSIATGEAGATLSLQGSEKIQVKFAMASTFNLSANPPGATYAGAKSIVPTDTSAVAEVAQASDFEGQLLWGIGVRSHVGYSVSTLTNPPRVVIDFTS